MKTLLYALCFSVLASSAFAKCSPIKNLPDDYWWDTSTKSEIAYGYAQDGGFYVIAQNKKTCRVTAETMSKDEAGERFGLGDELETEEVDY